MQYLSQRLAAQPSSGRGGGRRGRRVLSAPQRERILDAAERLAAERGVAGSSIEAIVKAAGVSTVTFYEFFEDKEECFAAAIERAVEGAADELAAAAAGVPGDPAGGEPRAPGTGGGEGARAIPGDAARADPSGAIAGDGPAGELTWPEGVATGLRALIALIAAKPAPARLCLVEAQTGGPRLSARFDAALDRVAAVLRQGRALDTAPADLPATHEEATAGALAWLLRERLEEGDPGALEALYPELIDIALAPYLEGSERGVAATDGDGASRRGADSGVAGTSQRRAGTTGTDSGVVGTSQRGAGGTDSEVAAAPRRGTDSEVAAAPRLGVAGTSQRRAGTTGTDSGVAAAPRASAAATTDDDA